MEQDIIDKIENIRLEVKENRKAINNVYINLNIMLYLFIFMLNLLYNFLFLLFI